MNQAVAFSNFGTLVLIDVKNGRSGAGTSGCCDPVVALGLTATRA